MSASPTITIFNANPLPIHVSVNNGPQFLIHGTGPALDWTPQTPNSGGPAYSNRMPAQNVLAPGANFLTVTPGRFAAPFRATLNLPRNIQWNAVQIYLVFNDDGDLILFILNDGQFIMPT